MATFQIQNNDNALSLVSHDDFYKVLNGDGGYLYYKQGGKHLALLPTVENIEAIRLCRQVEYAERDASVMDTRCRDEKGQLCRYQHDENGNVIRNEKSNPVHAKCGDCPRNGWTGGKRENCCIRNYCKVEDCTACPHPREYHTHISLDWLTEDKDDSDEADGAGFFIVDPNVDIQGIFEQEEISAALHMAINQLPLDEQLVLKAIFWNRLSLRAYAAESGMSKSTVHRLYNRALESLKNILKNFC